MAGRAAVLGSPIAHSLSPVLHRSAYTELGLDWSYDAIEVTEAGLPRFVAGLDGSWVGLSLTMPLKRAVIDLLDEVRGVAATIQSVNTVLLSPTGVRVGENTDVPGMVAALGGRLRGPRATVLGGGATAASGLAALASLGTSSVEVYARNAARSAHLAELGARLGITVTARSWSDARQGLGADLILSTTPAGVADPLVDAVPDRPGLLFDVIYHPWPTQVAAAWAARGGAVVGGLELLVHQAALQVELMTGRRPAPVEAMRRAGKKALSARAGRA